MTRWEASRLVKYLNTVCDNVPAGLQDLYDVLFFAIIDLNSFVRFGRKGKHFDQACIFAKSIPEFADFNSEEFNKWLMHDEAYIDYITSTKL